VPLADVPDVVTLDVGPLLITMVPVVVFTLLLVDRILASVLASDAPLLEPTFAAFTMA